MADIRYALREGDATTTGCVLIAGKGFFFTHHGKTVALEGDTLSIADIVAKDPRFLDLPISPKEMLKMLSPSSRLVEKRHDRKGWSGGASSNW